MSNQPSSSDFGSTTGGALEEAGAANPPSTTDLDRSSYEKSMEERMAEFGARIDELNEKLDSMKEQAAVKYQDLKDKQRVASCKFKELKETSTDAFGEFKTGMDHAFEELSKAWEEMKTGCSNAAAKFEK